MAVLKPSYLNRLNTSTSPPSKAVILPPKFGSSSYRDMANDLRTTKAKPSKISISQLYAINGTLCVILHLWNCVWLFQRELGSLWDVIWEHPAMSSVRWDVFFCAIIGVVETRRTMSISLPPAIWEERWAGY